MNDELSKIRQVLDEVLGVELPAGGLTDQELIDRIRTNNRMLSGKKDKVISAVTALLHQVEKRGRIDELLELNKIGMVVAEAKGTDFEDLSGAYDKQILKRLADLTEEDK